jgi:hypothetical protein
MANETISDVRTHLFEALKGLTNKDAPMEIERAKAVADVAQTIINSAKVEVDYLKIAGGQGSGFIPEALPDPGKKPALTVRTHILK